MAKTKSQKMLEKANKNLSKLGDFSYSDSLGYKSAYDALLEDYNSYMNNPEANGYNAYIGDVNELFSQVMNQKPFSYNPEQDSLYQMYKNQYMSQGNSAMRNQMGVAAAASGGYNSSAAQTSALGAYQRYMDALSEKAVETYRNALDMYKYNQQSLLGRYNAARDMNSYGNNAFYQQADIKAQNMKNAYDLFNDDRSFQYDKYTNDRSYYLNQAKNALEQNNWLKEYKLQKKLYKGG